MMSSMEEVIPEVSESAEVPELSEAPSSPMKQHPNGVDLGYEPTTKEELRAWYVYDFGASPYFQVYVVGVFPVFVKWLAEGYAARSQGWTDQQIYSCSTGIGADDPANMKLPGLGITAGSFPVAVGWITTVVQMIGLLSFSSFGDYGPYRKTLLKRLTWTGCVAIFMNVLCFSPDAYWLAGLLRIVAGACFVLCINYYNAYLPLLMEAHPGPSRDSLAERIRLTDATSAKGNLSGYSGGLALLVISWLIHMVFECDPCGTPPESRVESASLEFNQIASTQVQMIEATHLDRHAGQSHHGGYYTNMCTATDIFTVPAICCAMVGIWWAVISSYALMQLKSRPGKPFPTNEGSILLLGWKDVFATFRTVLKYKQTLLFVIVYFISSDALATLVGNSFLIMEEEASASTGQWTTMTALHVNFVLGALAAFVGIFIYATVQRVFRISNKSMLMFQFAVMMAVAITCLAGGLRSIGFVPVMAPVSFTIGATQSVIRSVYSSLIPPGQEASMFAFYEITDKGSNLIGAMLTLIIHNLAHSYIPTMWYILFGYVASAAVLYFVDIEQGMKDLGKVDGSEAAEKGKHETAEVPPLPAAKSSQIFDAQC